MDNRRCALAGPYCGWGEVLLAAALLTFLNGLKPLSVDDGAYYYRAAQMARSPADPHGGPPFWDRDATPGTRLFVPPVFCAWWALGLRLGGQSEVFWRLWEFPVALLFVGALARLLRRFAAGVERPLLWATVFSPAVLPGFNLMIDVPMLALSLSAVAGFLVALERPAPYWALLAGALAGLAMQTKYSGVTAVAAFLAAGVLARRWRPTLMAATVAGVVFLSWEVFCWWKYGLSQFLFAMVSREQAAHGSGGAAALLTPLATIIGCVAPALVPWTLLARRAAARTVFGAIGAIVVAYAVLTLVPAEYAAWGTRGADGGPRLFLHYFTVDLIGWPLWWLVLTLVGREYLGRWRELCTAERFLPLWLAAEVLLYFPLTPFPAARRVMGIVVVLTLLVGQALTRRSCFAGLSRVPLYAAAALNIGAGLLFWSVDRYESRSQAEAVQHARAWLAEAAPSGTCWFTGEWGLQYYAWQAGMRPLVPGESHLQPGDCVLYPRRLAGSSPGVTLELDKLAQIREITLGDACPLSTQNGYYLSKHPLMHRREPQVQATLYRVTADYRLPATARVGAKGSLWAPAKASVENADR